MRHVSTSCGQQYEVNLYDALTGFTFCCWAFSAKCGQCLTQVGQNSAGDDDPKARVGAWAAFRAGGVEVPVPLHVPLGLQWG